MSTSIHNIIRSEYEKRRKLAFDRYLERKNEVCSCVPRVEEIEREIQLLGISSNKRILSGKAPAQTIVHEMNEQIEKLKNEKEDLLTLNNYPPNYLELQYSCKSCNDTGYIDKGRGSERCYCYNQQVINHSYSQSNLVVSEKENFSRFDDSFYPDIVDEKKYGFGITPRENINRIKERSLSFIENFTSTDEKNLFFSGPTGVGKTFMSSCIAMDILNSGRTVLYQTAPVLFDIINEYKMKAFKDDGYEDAKYRNIFDAELLIVDDLGTEPPSAARFAELLNILNIRQINNLTRPCKTIISTNIGVKELYEYYSERVASRIIGSFDILRFAGEDIRRLKLSGQ